MSPRTNQQFKEIRDSSRKNILNSALKLFSTNGFFNTSIRQIAKQANISTGLLYNYFKSKEELLTEIINNSFKKLNTNEELQSQQSIEQTITNFFNIIRTKQDLVRMLIQLGIQPKKFSFVNKFLIKKYEKEVKSLSTHFNNLMLENSEIKARLLMATLDGILFQVLVIGKSIPLDEMEKELLLKYSTK